MRARRALEQGRRVLLGCEPTPDGVLAAVGIGYLAHAPADGAGVRLARAGACQPALDEELVVLPPCADEAGHAFATRVLTGWCRAVGAGGGTGASGSAWEPGSASPRPAAARHVALACASDEADMPEVVHCYLRLGFAEGPGVPSRIADARVAALYALVRQVENECERTRQFARFVEQADGTLVATFRPRANTVPLVANHFAARLRPERFVLADPAHGVAALHEVGERHCAVVRLDAPLMDELLGQAGGRGEERYVHALWKRCYDALALAGRGVAQRGYDLRTSWMPRRVWEGLPELDPTLDLDPGVAPARYAGASPEAEAAPGLGPGKEA